MATHVYPARQDDEAPTELDALFRAHGRTVAQWALRLVAGSNVEPDDVVQDVFLVAQRKLKGGKWTGDAKVTTWLYRVTELVVRKKRARERWLQRFFGPPEVEPAAPSMRPSPLQALEARRNVATLNAILGKLDEKYRNVLVLYELEQMSGDEIAEVTGLKPSTVRVRLLRARELFDKHLLRLQAQLRSEQGCP